MDLYLPAIPATEHVEARPAPAFSSSGGETILVVEDETEVRRVAVAFLKSLGYKTYAAADGEEALKLLDEHDDIALVFSDVILGGGMDGIELARVVRDRRPGLPTLLTSGYEHPALPVGETPAEPLHLLRKPYRREELAQALRESFERRA